MSFDPDRVDFSNLSMSLINHHGSKTRLKDPESKEDKASTTTATTTTDDISPSSSLEQRGASSDQTRVPLSPEKKEELIRLFNIPRFFSKE